MVDLPPRSVRTLWPLPGGTGKYLTSLAEFVELSIGEPHIDEYVQRIIKRFEGVVSAKAAHSYTYVATNLGMLTVRRYRVAPTADGLKFAKTHEKSIVERALRSRVAGVEELLEEITFEPARAGELLARMQARGFAWKGLSQIRYRLRWLQEVGLVTVEGRARPIYAAAQPRRARGGKRALTTSPPAPSHEA